MWNNRNLAIYANGSVSRNLLKKAQNYGYVIATDLAALTLIHNGIIPDLAIGDFDTIQEKDFHLLKKKITNIKLYPREKNYTDLELAVKEALKLKPDSIDIFGATGTRIDHLLAAVFLLDKMASEGIFARIVDRNNEIFVVNHSAVLSKSIILTYLSLIPLTHEAVVSVKGTKYELSNQKIVRGQTIGISNRVSGSRCQITVHQGKLIIVRSKD